MLHPLSSAPAQICTGALAGLVSVTAGCSVIAPWAAVICGGLAAPVFVYGEDLLERLHIDDPVSAFPLHGLWGLLFVGLLGKEEVGCYCCISVLVCVQALTAPPPITMFIPHPCCQWQACKLTRC